MSWVSVIWSMVVTLCLTLAGIHLLIWSKERNKWSSFTFAVAAIAVAGTAVAELYLMYALTPQDVVAAIRWANLALLVMVGGLVGFVRLTYGLGNLWVGGVAVVLRLVGTILLFAIDQGPLIDQDALLPSIEFLGEPVTVVSNELLNPWRALNQLSTLFFFVFIIGASIRLWRSGIPEKRHRAIFTGGSIIVFFIVAAGISFLINSGVIQSPYIISFPFLLIVLVVAYDLTRDVLRGGVLANILLEREEHLRLAAQAAGIGSYSYNFVTENTSYSPELLAMFGLPEDAAVELDGDLVPVAIHPEDKPSLLATIRQASDPQGARIFDAELRIRRADGSERWLKVLGSTAFSGPDEDDVPLRLNGIVQDITTQKLTAQEIQDLQTQLAHAGRVSLLGQLSAALAHELSQPLGAILRNVEAADLMLRQTSPDLKELRAIVTDIWQDDRRASEVITKLRALLKKHSIALQPVKLTDLIAEVIALIRLDAAKRHIDIMVTVATDLPTVRGDRVHLQQVLLNVIINAMESLDESKGEEQQINIMARVTSQKLVEVSISDNGPGFSPESLQHLFDTFYTTKEEGMGMGLAVSKTIMEAHQGQIWVDTEQAVGATFRFTVPIVEPDDC